MNPEKTGTKAAAHYRLTVGPGECRTIRLRLSDVAPTAAAQGNGNAAGPFGGHFDEVFRARRAEADEFYAAVIPPSLDADAANVMRQALAGMLWSKQFYHYDVDKWLEERGSDPFKPTRKAAPRNDHWHHMYNGDVISMPDKWEYPWYAAWDLAFHVLALTLVDPDFGKQQLKLMLRERYMHPNGQIPAYEWNFGDVNPPVHAWSTIFTYRLEKAATGRGRPGVAQELLPEAAAELHLVGQPQGPHGAERLRGRLPGPRQHRRLRPQRAPADRRLPRTGRRHRLDGAVLPEHARDRRRAGDDRPRLRGHGAQVRRALPLDRLVDGAPGRGHRDVGRGGRLLLRRAPVARRPGAAAQGPVDGRSAAPLRRHDLRWGIDGEVPRARGAVRLVPRLSAGGLRHDPRPEASRASRAAGSPPSSTRPSSAGCWRRCWTRTSSSAPTASARCRATTPTTPTSSRRGARNTGSPTCRPSPTRGCSAATRTGGADLDAGQRPDHPGAPAVLPLLRRRVHRRMPHRFRPADEPVPGGRGDRASALRALPCGDPTAGARSSAATAKFQDDPHWRDCLLFYEYFHGDNGAGLGASHQTGWTGVIARLMHLFATLTPDQAMERGKKSYSAACSRAEVVGSSAGR